MTNLLVDLPRAIPDRWNLLKNSETHETNSETKVNCVEALRRSILVQGFLEKVANTAAKGRRESTRRIYGARASHFARWCGAQAVDPYTAPVTEIL